MEMETSFARPRRTPVSTSFVAKNQMKKILTVVEVVIFVLVAIQVTPAKKLSAIEKRQNRIVGRYQPKRLHCSECHGQSRNLLLLGIRPEMEKLKKCFGPPQMRTVGNLSKILPDISRNSFVLVLPTGSDDVVPEALTALAENLGNFSVLMPDNYSSVEVPTRCRSLGPICNRIKDLIPILNQMEKKSSRTGKSISTFHHSNAEKEISHPLERQMDALIAELCKRNKNHNKLVEILKDPEFVSSKDKNDANPSRHHVLSLDDILPLNSKSYDKNRPPKSGSRPTVVYFHVTVLSLDSINEESMTYVADIFLAQSWQDHRLRLPESMSEQYRILDVNWLREIWRPDSFFKNAKQVTFHEISIPNHYVWLYHDKTILYISKLTLVLSCAMKFEAYPHDVQTCSLMMESLSHTVQDLIFVWNVTDPLVVYPDIELPQLDISHNYTSDCTVRYSTGNFTCLAVVFTLKRRLGYHLLHTYIPSALIVVMSWISFWIKPEAIPARVTLGVTSLLTLATQNTQSQQSLPPVSYVKAIDIWMSSCSVFVFLSLMEFAVVNNYMDPVSEKSRFGKTTAKYPGDETFGADPNDFCGENSAFSKNGKEFAICIDRFSRYFFPVSFLVLNIVYWSVFV